MKRIFNEKLWVIVILTLYTLTASLVSAHRHWQFTSYWYDFGIFDQTAWQVSQLKVPIIPTLDPPMGKISWGDHLNLSIIFLAPLYWIWPNQAVIFVAQAISVGLGGWFIYLILEKEVRNFLARMAVLTGYLGFIGIQNALYTDVHNIVFALFTMAVVFWSIYNHRWKAYWLGLLVMIGWQENLASVGVGIGMFLVIKERKNWKIGLATIFVCIVYGILATKVIIPFFNKGDYVYSPNVPNNVSTFIKELFVPLDPKLKTILISLATFGLAPLLSIASWPLMADHFVQRFVFSDAPTRWSLGFHYSAPLSVIMSVATIETIKKWERIKRLSGLIPFWALGTIAVVLFIHRIYMKGPLMMAINGDFYRNTGRNQTALEFIEKVPPDGLIMAANNLAAHLSHSNVMLLNLKFETISPEWIVISNDLEQNPNNYYTLRSEDFKKFYYDLHWSPNYKLFLDTPQGLQVYQRKSREIVFCIQG